MKISMSMDFERNYAKKQFFTEPFIGADDLCDVQQKSMVMA
jgi:hypothetical protein